MADRVHIAIIGSGPAGLSAAGRAAHYDRQSKRSTPSYVLFEGSAAPAKTIQRYQKGKHVMAEPGYLDLRSDFEFAEGSREGILQKWVAGLEQANINIRYGAEVTSIKGSQGDFTILLGDGATIGAEYVVLAIGLEGNPRRLGVKGEELPGVEYHLDDPEAFRDETIIVVGAGDSAIENALALARAERCLHRQQARRVQPRQRRESGRDSRGEQRPEHALALPVQNADQGNTRWRRQTPCR